METHNYVRNYTLAGIMLVAVVLTVASVMYAIANTFVPTDVQVVVDQAVQRQDMTVCGSVQDSMAKSCYDVTYAVLAAADQCARIPYTDVRTRCQSYFTKLAALETKSAKLRQNFTYDQVAAEVTFKDGSTKRFKVLVADTDPKRVQGLSYVQSMGAEEGMLFAFPPDLPELAFHMKDMLLPLDIIYLNKDLTPVQSFRNLPSCAGFDGECPLQTRKGGDVQYVLEVLPQGKEAIGMKLL